MASRRARRSGERGAEWLGPGVGAESVVLAVVLQPGLLVPILVTGAALGGLLLLSTLALIAVCIIRPEPARRRGRSSTDC
jgi:hypothetical protein